MILEVKEASDNGDKQEHELVLRRRSPQDYCLIPGIFTQVYLLPVVPYLGSTFHYIPEGKKYNCQGLVNPGLRSLAIVMVGGRLA